MRLALGLGQGQGQGVAQRSAIAVAQRLHGRRRIQRFRRRYGQRMAAQNRHEMQQAGLHSDGADGACAEFSPQPGQLGLGGLNVLLELQQHVERAAQQVLFQFGGVQEQ